MNPVQMVLTLLNGLFRDEVLAMAKLATEDGLRAALRVAIDDWLDWLEALSVASEAFARPNEQEISELIDRLAYVLRGYK